MNLTTEITEEKQKILIVSKTNFPFISLLKSELKKHQAEVFFSSKIPKSLASFDYCLFINETLDINTLMNINVKRLILIFFNQGAQMDQFLKNLPHQIKVINITGDIIKENDIERILWFSFSQTKEKYLRLFFPKVYKIEKEGFQRYWQKINLLLTPKRLITLFISFFILIHLAFIIPLIGSFIFIYRGVLLLKQEDFKKTNSSINASKILLKTTQRLYLISRPTYSLFSLALFPDNLIDMAEKTQNILSYPYEINTHAKEIQKLLFKKNKNTKEKLSLNLHVKKLKKSITYLDEDLKSINQKIPSYFLPLKNIKSQLLEVSDGVSKIKKIFEHLDIILAKDKELKYLIFFANNRELRPGGGFLGSFGVIDVKDYSIEDIKIYDVYDADGQLKIHIEPPEPIKKYLNLPHWFLRDSNFSPDFLENYLKAQFFLEKELQMSDFAGAILITTTSIEQVLSAFGDIYLPDFGEYINSKNFYLKAQIYSEKGFFPGSIQKKSFLSALTRQIVINLENVSFIKLAMAIKKSLDEKQIVIYFDNQRLQNFIDMWYWSGRLIEPKCANSFGNCFADYFFAYDANLGVNKVNFFINRSFIFKTNFDSKGTINHLLIVNYKNDSPGDFFPGGTYRNFFQVLLPKNTILKSITKDGVIIEDYTEQINQLKNIGFFFEVPPKKTVEIKIDYQLSQMLEKGKQIYQLIIQKQIGSSNNDLILEFNLPKNIFLLNQNFSPLVKERNIVYNTVLNTDKIFFIELIKE